MASLEELPVELQLQIAQELTSFSDLNALASTCRRAYAVIDPLLYSLAAKDSEWFSVLHWAAKYDATDAFHIAAARGCLKFMQFLFQEGYEADVNRKDPSGYAPLHYAFGDARRHQTIQWLQARGADIDAEFKRGATLLHLACYDANFEDAGFLLDAGASVNKVCEWNHAGRQYRLRPIDICCMNPRNTDGTVREEDPGTSFHKIMSDIANRSRFIEKLLLSGASLDPLPGELSPVAMAASQHWIHILELFKKAGRDYSTEDQAIVQALLLKKEGEYLHRDVSQPIADSGLALGARHADCPQQRIDFGSPRRLSLFRHSYNGGNLHLSRLLMEYGAHEDQLHDLFDEILDDLELDPLRDLFGNDDDHEEWNQAAADLRYLLDCDISGVLLKSPKSLLKALKKQSIKIARILLDAGSPNASGVTDAGQSCLHFLAASPLANTEDYLHVTKRVLELGTDPKIGRGLPDMSPMWLALGNERWAFARLLVDYGTHITGLEASGLNRRHHPHHHHQSFLWGLRNAPPPSTLGTKVFSELLDSWYLITRDEKSSLTQGATHETALFYTYSLLHDPYSGIKWLLNPEVDINWAPDRGPTALANLVMRLSRTDEYLKYLIGNVMILLERGADPLRKDGRGISAMDIIKLDLEECATSQGAEVSLLDYMNLERDADNRLYKLRFRSSLWDSWETRSYAEDQDNEISLIITRLGEE
ncbi:hypothetical protein DL768_010527 [Monosporascus sp. mg162]|nr:hypothetical protein DL768_010527 [Monosporascus sp. mg162]